MDSSIKTDRDSFDFFSAYLPGFTTRNLHKLLSLYPVSEFFDNPSANLSAQFYRSGRILRDILFTCQPILLGDALDRKGLDVFYYEQNQTIVDENFAFVGSPGLGVVHTSEIAYVFGNLSHYDADGLPFNVSPSDFALKRRESRSWSTFAATGRPSRRHHHTLHGWTQAYSKPYGKEIFVIGGPFEGLWADDGPFSIHAVREQRLRERCGFLNSWEIIQQLQY